MNFLSRQEKPGLNESSRNEELEGRESINRTSLDTHPPSLLRLFFKKLLLAALVFNTSCATIFAKPRTYERIDEHHYRGEIIPKASKQKVEASIDLSRGTLNIFAQEITERDVQVTPTRIVKKYQDRGINPTLLAVDAALGGLLIYGGIKTIQREIERDDKLEEKLMEQKGINCDDEDLTPSEKELCSKEGIGAGIFLGGVGYSIFNIVQAYRLFFDKKLSEETQKRPPRPEPFSPEIRPLASKKAMLLTGKGTKYLGETDEKGKLSVDLKGALQCGDFDANVLGGNFTVQLGDETVEIPAIQFALAIMSPEEKKEYLKILETMKRSDKIGPLLAYQTRFPNGCLAAAVQAFVQGRIKQTFQGIAKVLDEHASLPASICSGDPRLNPGERVYLMQGEEGFTLATLDGRCEGQTALPFNTEFVEYFEPLGTALKRRREEDRLAALTQECQGLFDEAKRKKGTKPLQDFIDRERERCPQSIIWVVREEMCRRRWNISPVPPSPSALDRINAFIEECPILTEAQEARAKAIAKGEASICGALPKVKTVKNFEALQRRAREFQQQHRVSLACMPDIERIAREVERGSRPLTPYEECEKYGLSWLSCIIHMGQRLRQAAEELEDASIRAGMGPIWGGHGTSARKPPQRPSRRGEDAATQRAKKAQRREKCEKDCETNYVVHCGKGIAVPPVPVPIPSPKVTEAQRRAECSRLYKRCMDVCKGKYGD